MKPEVVFKVQKMARYALFCLIMGSFKAEVPVFARLWPVMVRVRVSFTTGAVWSAILATAGLLVRPKLRPWLGPGLTPAKSGPGRSHGELSRFAATQLR